MKNKLPPTRCIAVDVDGTLIYSGRLNQRLADWCEAKKVAGWDVVLWSARGRKYAEKVAEKFGIVGTFTSIVGKPGYIVDDLGWQWVRGTKIVRRFDDADD